MKICFVCNLSKELEEFYKHKEMKDGRLNKCKECCKAYARNMSGELLERKRKRDRNRPNKEERSKKHNDRIKRMKIEDPEKWSHFLKVKNEWSRKNKHKKNAQTKVRRALLKGKLVKPEACSKCSVEADIIEAHHEDYSKPLDVAWLCKRCHTERHIELRNLNRV